MFWNLKTIGTVKAIKIIQNSLLYKVLATEMQTFSAELGYPSVAERNLKKHFRANNTVVVLLIVCQNFW